MQKKNSKMHFCILLVKCIKCLKCRCRESGLIVIVPSDLPWVYSTDVLNRSSNFMSDGIDFWTPEGVMTNRWFSNVFSCWSVPCRMGFSVWETKPPSLTFFQNTSNGYPNHKKWCIQIDQQLLIKMSEKISEKTPVRFRMTSFFEFGWTNSADITKINVITTVTMRMTLPKSMLEGNVHRFLMRFTR